jgi:Short C-terminal domain
MRRRGIGRVGRPGVMGTMARTAVVAGTATAVAGSVSRHQQANAQQTAEAKQYEMEQQQLASQPPPAAPTPTADVITQLKELASLKDAGVLTEAEFAAQKAKLLA